MSSHARPGPTHGASRKRKERDGPAAAEPTSAPANNRLLAGYLAHEFLTNGTVFGQRLEPARPEPVRNTNQTGPVGPPNAYAAVAYLLKTDGAHVPGVVNPTQLARWIQLPPAPARVTTPL